MRTAPALIGHGPEIGQPIQTGAAAVVIMGPSNGLAR
jgi:hypothetical protein